jgi:predicted nucleic acid-binding protein
MLGCDTSVLIAYFDASDAHHDDVNAAVEADSGPFVVSPYVLAELDYLLATRRGVREELAVLTELASGE